MARMGLLRSRVALGFALSLLAGCEQKGTAQKAGEKMDKRVEQGGKATQKAGDKDTGKEAEKKVKEATK
jgi:hypothetical protein